MDKPENDVLWIILEYGKIKQQLATLENRSFYFRRATDSYKEKLTKLNQRFESIRNDFNSNTVDELITQLSTLKNESQNKELLNSHTMQSFFEASQSATLNYLETLILLKSRTTTIYPLEHYFENTNDLMVLGNW